VLGSIHRTVFQKDCMFSLLSGTICCRQFVMRCILFAAGIIV
jgi:hypothetical protein